MDFLDPSNKRSYNIRLFIGFFLSAVIIILGTLILSLITAGYTINTKTGQIVQNGLMFINSTPASASIYINSKYTTKTNARFELRSGNYGISLYAPGYDTWTTNVALLGGNVVELNYPLLVPTKPLVSSIAKYTSQPQVFTQTPNQHWLLVTSATTANSFDVYDTTNIKTPVTTVTIPTSVLVSTAGANTFSVVQWASDNQDILLEDQYNGTINYIVFNYLVPANSYNLNQTFTTSFTSAELLNSQFNTPLLLDASTGNLYVGNEADKTTTLILSKVINYAYYGTNKFLYATADGTSTSQTSIKFSNLTKSYLVKNVPQANIYMLHISSYGGHYYYLVGGGGIYDYIYRDLANQKSADNKIPTPFTLMVNNIQPLTVSNSTGQRYISLQAGSNFSVYDIETQDHYRYQLTSSLESPNPASWMDDNRLISFSSGKMIVFDFDGTNIFNIASANNLFNGIFSPNANATYYLNYDKTSTDWILNRAGMVANQH